MAGQAQVLVDRQRCLGTGICVAFAPETFAHDEQTKAVVLDPPGDPIEIIGEAVEACPTGALSLTPEGTEA